MAEVGTVLVTGANRGIGLGLCRQLSNQDANVIGVCRASNPELDSLGIEVIDEVDVTSDDSIQGLLKKLGGRKLDWLVNNAGILVRDSLEKLDFESIERQFQVNSIGPLRVALALRDSVKPGGKIFVISSNVGSIADNTSGGLYGYRMSKAAVNMGFKSLSVDLKPAGIGVFILHPGWVKTDMGGPQAMVSVEESVSGLIERMKEFRLEDTGTFRHARGHDLAW